jgi:hypothetical protein
MWLILIGFAITAIGLGRSALIVFGLYKDPILWSFEQYGPDERLPLPLATLIGWIGALVVLLGVWMSMYFPLPMPLVTIGAGIIFAAGLCFYNYMYIYKWYYRVIGLPRWHHELLSRTTRYERRRIAYMWLHLPWRLRLLYNSSNASFFIWADFVIMGTIREEESEVFDEHFYAGR